MIDFGLTPQDFRTGYFEQQVYLRKAALSSAPLQWTDLDAVLQLVEPDETIVQLFNNGQVPPQHYIDTGVELGKPRRRLNKHGLYGALHGGATMVVNRMENYSVAAQRLCAEVGRFAGHQTTSNAYVSFGGKGTFGKHWDTHDVFALQLVGRKRWQVFAPSLPLPLSSQTSKGHQHECPATPVLDCELTAGDMLYVPRGWWHQVIPFDEPSLHLSVGVYAPTVMDYLTWLSARQLPLHLAARKGLLHKGVGADLKDLMQTLTEAVLNETHVEAFKRDLAVRERLHGEFDMGLFLDRTGGALSDAAVIRCNSVHPVNVERSEVPLNGGQLKLEPVSRAVLGLVSTVMSMTLAQIHERLPHLPRPAVRAALMNLASYELLNIERG